MTFSPILNFDNIVRTEHRLPQQNKATDSLLNIDRNGWYANKLNNQTKNERGEKTTLYVKSSLCLFRFVVLCKCSQELKNIICMGACEY